MAALTRLISPLRDAARAVTDAALDASVVASFDRTGFERHARRFEPIDARLDGRIWLITGANSGIGRATAADLAARGATVVMLCRDPQRGAEARDALRAETDGDLRLGLLDLANPDAGRRVGEILDGLCIGQVDGLIHNAGLLVDDRRPTADDLELMVAAHLVGPLRITHAVLDRLRPTSRIIWVSSGGMYLRTLSVERLTAALDPAAAFDGVEVYADTKRAQVVLSEQLAARLAGRAVVHAMHPGWVDTPGVIAGLPLFHTLTRPILRTPAQGADTVVWLATAPEARRSTGRFWFDRQPRPTHFSRFTRADEAERKRLWQALCRWSGLSPEAFDPPRR